MMPEIHKELILHLYLLVIAHPRLAVSILLPILGAVAIWVTTRGNKAKQHTMADPKTPTPVTRSSSSSSYSSSDLLLPTHIPHQADTGSRRSSSWPAPVPWRSSWGFLEQPVQQPSSTIQEPLLQEQPAHQPELSSSVPTSNTHLLMLPSTARRTGSMEARKGSSACAFPEETGNEIGQGFGERRLNSWGLCPGAGGSSEEGGGADVDGDGGSVLVGVGGQFS